MKRARSLLRKKQGEEATNFEIAASQWTPLKQPAFESDAVGTDEKGQSGFPLNNQPIEPGSGKSSSGFLKWSFFIILIGYTLFSYYHVPFLTWVGSLLVLEHPVKRADLIVCTPGDPFEVGLMAADLYKKKMAKQIFIPETPPSTALMLVNEQGEAIPPPGSCFSVF